MSHKISYAPGARGGGRRTPIVSILRIAIVLGVWCLVGLAGLSVWTKLAA